MKFPSLAIPLLVATALLAGCGTVSNRTSPAGMPQEVFDKTDTGVIILSTGAGRHCFSEATYLITYEAATRKPTNAAAIFVDNYALPSDFSGHYGTVNALHFHPGAYYFSPRIANPFAQTVKAPELPFTVKAGETVYLGEIFMPKSCSLNTSFEVNDFEERDLKLARERNPAIDRRPVGKRLIQLQ